MHKLRLVGAAACRPEGMGWGGCRMVAGCGPSTARMQPSMRSVVGEDGRSGRIRTADPQSPRLVRYQAALRSGCRPYSGRPRLRQCRRVHPWGWGRTGPLRDSSLSGSDPFGKSPGTPSFGSLGRLDHEILYPLVPRVCRHSYRLRSIIGRPRHPPECTDSAKQSPGTVAESTAPAAHSGVVMGESTAEHRGLPPIRRGSEEVSAGDAPLAAPRGKASSVPLHRCRRGGAGGVGNRLAAPVLSAAQRNAIIAGIEPKNFNTTNTVIHFELDFASVKFSIKSCLNFYNLQNQEL